MRTIGFILSLDCFPLLVFHFDQLFDAFSAPCCSFLSCFRWAAASELPYDWGESSMFLFWLFLMLVTYCSCILIQSMSVFLFFHSPRFFWFVLCETLLILCCLVPSFNYHIDSPLLPCFHPAFPWIQCLLLLLKQFLYFALLLPKPFALPLPARPILANFLVLTHSQPCPFSSKTILMEVWRPRQFLPPWTPWIYYLLFFFLLV